MKIRLLLLVLLTACGSSTTRPDSGSPPPPADGSVVDSGTDPGIDSSTPVPGVDAGAADSSSPDSGPGATPDGGTPDATPPMGSAAGADPRPGFVGCGDTSCSAPDVCCVSLSGAMCGAADSCSGGFSAAGTCDGPEDCDGGGSACCVHFGMFDPMNGAFCLPDGCPSGDNELCHSDADCGSGTCVACEPPTGGVLDVTYGICSPDGMCPSPYTAAS